MSLPARDLRPSGIARRVAVLAAFGLLLVALLAGCASLGPEPASQEVARYAGRVPVAAFYRPEAGELLLEYETAGRSTWLGARWLAEDELDEPRYGIARLDLAEAPPSGSDAFDPSMRPVRLMAAEAWSTLVGELLSGLAPDGAAQAVLLAVQGRDFVLFRESSGKLRVLPHAAKPPERQVVRFVREAEFADQAMERVRVQAASADAAGSSPPRLLLYPAGGIATGASYVFFDLDADRSVFVVGAAAPVAPGGDAEVGLALRMTEALVVRSHLLEPLMRPVSMAVRLLKSVVHTVMAWFPHGALEQPGRAPPLAQGPGMDLDEWEARLDDIASSPRLSGTVRPLIDGEAFFGRLVQSIQDARESIDLRLYIFDTDDYALSIADLLKERSREVRVRVLIDQIGSLAAGAVAPASAGGQEAARRAADTVSITDYLREGSQVEVRVSPNPWLTADHAKVIVVDGRTAFTGGMNIGYEYRYDWHDFMVELSGPIVGRLARDFERQWAYTGPFGDLAYFFDLLRGKVEDTARTGDQVELRPLYTGIVGTEILTAQLAAIERARRTIWIEHSYVSDDEVIAALVRARRRGVDVRVILPTRNDSGLMAIANLVAANQLLANGVRVYAYPGMTHVKAAIYDGWACFGSANFDKLSLRINFETNLASSDPRLTSRLIADLFEPDFARSREITEPFSIGWSTYVASFIADQL